MSHELISRSPDLRRLQDEGYEIEIRSGYLLLHHVPYVTSSREVAYGTLVSELSLAGDTTTTPTDHVVRFVGGEPHTADGRPYDELINSRGQQTLAEGIIIDFTFSQKPVDGYPDYFEKLTTYATMLCSQALRIDSSATCTSLQDVEPPPGASTFCYVDTASSRAGITNISHKLEGHSVAIVGLGGSGSYILDLLAKTPVAKIYLFDGDHFLQHNAFRSPGAPTIEELETATTKVGRFAEIYGRMHRGIAAHPYYIDETNVEQLDSMDFVFLSIDSGVAKGIIVDRLESKDIPFIDVGMGIYESDGALGGQLRVTTSTPGYRAHVRKRVSFDDAEEGLDEYNRNIQIVDLNALNAALAVIRWKKYCGFYSDFDREHSSVYVVDGNALVNEEQGVGDLARA